MATVLDLSDPRLSLPDFILVDASVLLETRTPSGAPPSRRQAAVNQFLRLVQQAIIDGNTIALACTLTLEECYFKILQANLMDPTSAPNERSAVARRLNLAPNRVSWHQLYKDFPLLIQNYLPDLEAFFRWVQGIPITILESRDLSQAAGIFSTLEESMRHFIGACNILPKDAYLIAVAERIDVKHIATLDNDFIRLGADFTVYMLP